MIDGGPMIEYYRTRFVSDLQRTRPRWFIDAVGGENFFYKDRAATGHEILPDLAREIREHYELIDDVDGSRLYRRR